MRTTGRGGAVDERGGETHSEYSMSCQAEG